MAPVPDPTSSSDKTFREATEWFVRLANPEVADEERRAYQRWLMADRAHAEAMDEVRDLWDRLEEPAALIAPETIAAASTQRAFWRQAAFAAAAVFIVAAALVWRDQGIIERWLADHATAPGERREYALADGSRVLLDGDSAISEAFNAKGRSVTLVRGRAWFDVSPDPERPFVVRAGALTTRVLGTAFGVDEAEGSVTVERGKVAVFNAQGQEARLTGGERISLSDGHLGSPAKVALDVALAWRRGLIVLDAAPLRLVIDELSRMAPGRIIISDAQLAELRLSGVFRTDDPDAVMEAMRTALGLKVISVPGFATLIYR